MRWSRASAAARADASAPTDAGVGTVAISFLLGGLYSASPGVAQPESTSGSAQTSAAAPSDLIAIVVVRVCRMLPPFLPPRRRACAHAALVARLSDSIAQVRS